MVWVRREVGGRGGGESGKGVSGAAGSGSEGGEGEVCDEADVGVLEEDGVVGGHCKGFRRQSELGRWCMVL